MAEVSFFFSPIDYPVLLRYCSINPVLSGTN